MTRAKGSSRWEFAVAVKRPWQVNSEAYGPSRIDVFPPFGDKVASWCRRRSYLQGMYSILFDAASTTHHTSVNLATVLSIVALGVAIIALVVSWLGHRHTVARNKRLEARSIKVTCSEMISSVPISAYDARLAAEPHQQAALAVRAVNLGFRPVEIRGVHFQTANDAVALAMPINGMSETVPKRLDDGESVTVFYVKHKLDAEAAKHGDTIARVIVTDADENAYSTTYPN